MCEKFSFDLDTLCLKIYAFLLDLRISSLEVSSDTSTTVTLLPSKNPPKVYDAATLALEGNSTMPIPNSDNKSTQTTYTAVVMAFITISFWILIVLTICYFSTRPLHKTFLFKSSAGKSENGIEMIQI